MLKEKETHLLERLEQLFERSGSFQALRKKAWDQFINKGLSSLPTLAKEVLFGAERRPLTIADDTCEQFPKECVVLPFTQAKKTYGSLIQSTWRKTLNEESAPLALLNLALHQEGLFVYIPPGIHVDKLVYLRGGLDAFSRVHLHLGAGASLSLCFHTEQSGHLLIEGVLEERARLHLYRRQGGVLDTFRFSLKKEAKLHAVSVTDGEGNHYQEYLCRLVQEGAHVDVSMLTMLKKAGRAHTQIKVEHRAERTTSHQLVKTILQGAARSFFEGCITIDKKAQQTEAKQLSRALILSKGAQATSRPLLSIEADDVQASHGATISQLDERELFYLCSRGVSLEEAQKLLIAGFCQEILTLFPRKAAL